MTQIVESQNKHPAHLSQFITIILWLLFPFFTVLVMVYLLWSSLLTRSIAIAYIAYCYADKSHENGGRQATWFRRLWIWKVASEYFPVSLRKTASLPPSKSYIFGLHPHGVLGVCNFYTFSTYATGFEEKFPGLKIHSATLDSNFQFPIMRDLLLAVGLVSVSKKSITNVIRKGKSIVIVVGGAAEALESRPNTNTLILRNRYGFVKMAIRNGASLVPVFAFGETDIWDQVDNPEGSFVRKFQTLVKSITKISPVFFYGRFGVFPYRRPITVVVGEPIDCAKEENPSEEDVRRVHELYIQKLEKLYSDHKDELLPHRKQELKII